MAISGLLLCCLAIGFAGAKIEESAFRPQREYVYLYQTQVVSGLPGLSSVFSAVRVNALARVQFVTASRVKAALVEVELLKFNEAIQTMNPTNRMIPRRYMTPLVGQEANAIIQELTKPVMFDYIAGHVSNFQTSAVDPHWSVNLKRGLITLLEVNLEQRMSLETNMNRTTVSFAAGATYKCMDPTPFGLTETVYTVVPDKVIPNAYTVLKARNFTNAVDSPVWIKSNIASQKCLSCEQSAMEEEAITGSSIVRYAIIGDRSKFLVSSVVAESKFIIFARSGPKAQIQSVINQTLTLLDAADIKAASPIPEIASPTKRSLTTFVPELALDPMNPFSNETQSSASRAGHATYPKEKVVSLLKRASVSMTDTLAPEATALITTCIDVLRNTEAAVVEELVKTYITRTPPSDISARNIRKVLLKILPVVGTAPVARILIQNIQRLPSTKAPYIVGRLALSAEPNVHVMKMLMELARSSATSSPKLRRATVLAIGALTWKLQVTTDRYMNHLRRAMNSTRIMMHMENSKVVHSELSALRQRLQERMTQTATLSNTLIEGVVSLFRSILQKNTMSDMILALKAIGNAGCKPMLGDIRAVLTNPSLNPLVRSQAAFALRKMAMYKKQEVIGMLMPLITNLRETTVVRLACVDALVMARPDATVWTAIASIVRYDMDIQFSSYVSSLLTVVSNTSHPCFRTIAKQAAEALAMTAPARTGWTYSRVYSQEYFYHARGTPIFGGQFFLAYYGTNQSFIPQAASTSVNAFFLGRSSNLIEIGYNTQGLQAVFDKWFGPKGILTARKSLFDIFSRQKRSAGGAAQARIDEIFQKIGVVARKELAPTGHVYVKFNDDELMYYPLSETLQNILTTGKIATSFQSGSLQKTVNKRNVWVMADTEFSVPTSCGLPIKFRFTAINAYLMKGSMNAKIAPALFESERTGKAPTTAEASVNLRVTTGTEMYMSMHIDGFKIASGVAVRARKYTNLPVVGSIKADLVNNKVFITKTPPVSNDPITKIEVYPLTFVEVRPSTSTPIMIREEKIIPSSYIARNVPFVRNITRGRFGFNLAVSGEFSVGRVTRTPVPCPLFGYSALYLWSRPRTAAASVKPVIVELALVSQPKNALRTPHHSNCNTFYSFLTGCTWVDDDQLGDEETAAPVAANSSAPLTDYVDLKNTVINTAQLKAKLQTKVKDASSLNAVGSKWGLVAVVKSSDAAAPAKLHVEALWISSRRGYVHQFAARVAGTAVPSINRPPLELTVHSEVRYPNVTVVPETLFTPAYQEALQQNLRFILGMKAHHSVLSSLNSTILTRAIRDAVQVQHEPIKGIERIIANVAAQSRFPALKIWRPILNQLNKNYRHLVNNYQQVLDPFNLFRKEAMIVNTFNKQVSVLKAIQQQVQRIRTNATSTETVDLILAHYALMKQYLSIDLIGAIAKMGSKVSAFSKGQTLLAQAQNMWAMYKKEVAAVCALMESGKLIPTAKIASPYAAEIVKITKLQANMVRLLLSTETVMTIHEEQVQSLFTATSSLLRTMNITTVTSPCVPTVAALTQVAIYNQLIRHLLDSQYSLVNSVLKPRPTNQISQTYKYVMKFDALTGILVSEAGTLFMLEFKKTHLAPTLRGEEKEVINLLSTLLSVQSKIRLAIAEHKMTAPDGMVPASIVADAKSVLPIVEAIKFRFASTSAPPNFVLLVDCLRVIAIQRNILEMARSELMFGNRQAGSEIDSMVYKLVRLEYFLTSLVNRYSTTAARALHVPHVLLSDAPMRSVDMKLQELSQEINAVKQIIQRKTSVPPSQARSLVNPLTAKLTTIISECKSILTSGALWADEPTARQSSQLFASLINQLMSVLTEARSMATSRSPAVPPSSIRNFISRVEEIKQEYEAEASKRPPSTGSMPLSSPATRDLEKLTTELAAVKTQLAALPTTPKSSIMTVWSTIQPKLDYFLAELNRVLTSGRLWAETSTVAQTSAEFKQLCFTFKTAMESVRTEVPEGTIKSYVNVRLEKVNSILRSFSEAAKRHGFPPMHATIAPPAHPADAPTPSVVTKIQRLSQEAAEVTAIIQRKTNVPPSQARSLVNPLTAKLTTIISECKSILTSGALWADEPTARQSSQLFASLINQLMSVLTEARSMATSRSPAVPPSCLASIRTFTEQIQSIKHEFETEAAKRHASQPMHPGMAPSAPYPTGIMGFINVRMAGTPVIVAKIYGSKSVEQILEEISQINPFTRSPLFQEVVIGGPAVTEVTSGAYKYMIQLNEYRHIHVMASIPNPRQLSPRVKNLFYTIKNALIGRFYYTASSRSTPENTIPSNSVSAMVVFRPTNKETMDAYLTTPRETVSLTGLRMTKLAQAFIPVSIRSTPVMVAGYLTDWRLLARCLWSGPLVRTFDRSYVPVPKIGTCPTVVAMDCSPAKSFAIIATPTMEAPEQTFAVANTSKKIEMFGEGHIIEIIPAAGGAPTIKIDGAVKRVEVGSPVIIEQTLSYNRPAAVVKIMKYYYGGQLFVKVEMPVLGISLITDTYYVDVMPSIVFRGKTCGLCSNFDGQIYKELTGPTGTVFKSPDSFVRSYVLGGAQCQRPFPEPTAAPMMEHHSTAAHGHQTLHAEACAQIHKTVIKSRSKGKRACFSIHPIAECASACKSSKRERISVEFHCMEASSPLAQKWIQESENRVIEEAASKPATFSISLKHATQCIP